MRRFHLLEGYRRLNEQCCSGARVFSGTGATDLGQHNAKEEKQRMVNDIFSRVATTYDVMNDAMSFGLHRLWKDRFVELLNPVSGIQHLDVAGGTGDVAFRMLDQLNRQGSWQGSVTVIDINADMLRQGKARADALGLSGPNLLWKVGNAEMLPMLTESQDSYTIAFGIRNVPNRRQALLEAHRVLKPGGRFLCMEFTQIKDPTMHYLYQAWSQVLPWLGRVIADDCASYEYLVKSIEQFPDADTWAEQLQDAGFRCVEIERSPDQVVAIHSAYKLSL